MRHRSKRLNCSHINFYFRINVVYWPPTPPNMPFQNGRSAYSIGVGELGWQYGTWLKSHSTVTNWYTGRKWPVNCMTVISARWRSNMPFKRRWKCIFRWSVMGGDWVGGELIYNWVYRKFDRFWRQDAVEKANIQRKGPSDPRLRVWKQDVVEKASTQQRAGTPGIRLNNSGERERNADGHTSREVNMFQFCSVSNSLSRTTLSFKVRGIFF